MPNHVNQKLTITGSANDVAAFVATARGAAPMTGCAEDNLKRGFEREIKLTIQPLCFHMIAPLPDEYSEKPYGHGESYGYHAEAKGWGVKWGPYSYGSGEQPSLSNDGTWATYEFQCAWGPPVEALRRASLRYRTLKFWLSWGGEGPCRGRHSFAAGQTTLALEDNYQRDIAPDCATDEEYELDEDAACAKNDVAERKYILSHDEWVRSCAPEAPTLPPVNNLALAPEPTRTVNVDTPGIVYASPKKALTGAAA